MADHRDLHDTPKATTMISNNTRRSNLPSPLGEGEGQDVDEPPDGSLKFSRVPLPLLLDGPSEDNTGYCNVERKQSLLTQALTSPNLKSLTERIKGPAAASYASQAPPAGSATSMTELTSDGNFTTPPRSATPSPPLPTTGHFALPLAAGKEHASVAPQSPPGLNPLEHPTLEPQQAPAAVVDLPKKRCITFACPQPRLPAPKPQPVPEPEQASPPKRPCMLRFACPSRPSRETVPATPPSKLKVAENLEDSTPRAVVSLRRNSDDSTLGKNSEVKVANREKDFGAQQQSQLSKRQLKEKRARTADGSKLDDDEWTDAQPTTRCKITVNDTLRKENIIRKLAEEVEEEVEAEEQEENEDGTADDDEDGDESGKIGVDDESDEDDIGSDGSASDGGNETDDEDGFAESDIESEANSAYQFWTPGPSANAVSGDALDTIRTHRPRTMTESSIESVIDAEAGPVRFSPQANQRRRNNRPGRSRTPELPDSTDFVCGTLDEDRPLEAAYQSCMEQRRLAKHQPVPQDVDPSFPTDEPDDDDDDVEIPNSSHALNDDAGHLSDRHTSTCEQSCIETDRSRERTRSGRSPARSPRHPRSPPPPKRSRSPAPKRAKSPAPAACRRRAAAAAAADTHRPAGLFTHSPTRAAGSPPRQHPRSPPSSPRRMSTAALGTADTPSRAINLPRLAQRPHLAHARPRSLPRTPNPFWREHKHGRQRPHVNRASTFAAVTAADAPTETDAPGRPSRGPIDIVQGLASRNCRRRERESRAHGRRGCAAAGVAGPPGRGAERMREVGLEMADRWRGYGYRGRVQLMLSV